MVIAVRKKLKLRRLIGKKRNPPSFPPWIDLPREVTANILQRLGPVEILATAQNVCTTWQQVTLEPSFWRVIHMRALGYLYEGDFYCRQAVDRSQGELIDITIEYFCTNRLLKYISQRSSHLTSLRLVCCTCITSQGLIEAVKRLPELKVLQLFHMQRIRAADIETIGISCPMLESFTVNENALRFPILEVNDDDALAIGKTMPNLRHLQIIGYTMRNKGLIAILDGCPHLESLDLRRCYNVEFSDDLRKRCSEQIKDLKWPCDSCIDYEWASEIYDDLEYCLQYGLTNVSTDDEDNYSIRNYNYNPNPYLNDSSLWFVHPDEVLYLNDSSLWAILADQLRSLYGG